MAYQIAAIWITLRDLQGHSPTASLSRCDFLYSCAAVDKISTDSVSRSPSAISELLVVIWRLATILALLYACLSHTQRIFGSLCLVQNSLELMQ